MNKGEQMEFKAFAIDTGYRCGWTFVQTLLACMTFGQSILDIDWKSGLFIALGSVVYVLLKQIGKWCYDHIGDTGDLPIQNNFNTDGYKEMMGVEDDEEDDNMSEK